MIGAFAKPLELVAANDIAELPALAWPEGYEVEFKETLPHKTGSVHPWLNGQENIGDYARNEILAEVIAFANTLGGTVFLGIAETADNPPRAGAVNALPRIGDLARRFEDAARSCIDPPLPRLQIRAVETNENGGGVIIFRTQPSRAAPHRLTTTRESYTRHGASTIRMTMREIQDLTLNVARGVAGIDTSFKQRRSAFHDWAEKELHAIAYRVTALPLLQLPDPGRLFGKTGVFLHAQEFKVNVGSRVIDLRMPIRSHDERPCLRGITRNGTHAAGIFVWELHQNGMTDLWISVRPWKGPMGGLELALYHQEILAAVANCLSVVEHYRGYVGAPDAEYGMELEIKEFKDVVGRTAQLIEAGHYPVIYKGLFANVSIDQYDIKNISVVLPRLSVGSRNDFAGLVSGIDIDLYDALGIRRSTPPSLQVTI